MKHIIQIATSAIAMVLIVGSSLADAPPSLSYHWSGGHSPYREITVTISTSGVVQVSGQKQSLALIDYRTQLAPEEHSSLGALVESTDFFSQPEQDTTFARDVGKTELVIDLDGRRRSLTYSYRPSLEPLSYFIWKLITQAVAIEAIEHDDDIYTATGAVKPTHAGMKVLQPSTLKPPLLEYLRTQKDRQKLQWAYEALACLTTPEQFSGFACSELAKANRKELMLQIIGMSTGNIPDTHVQALCPVYLTFVQKNYHRCGELTQIEKEALSGFISILGEERYKEAVPLFLKWFEENNQPGITTSLIPLAEMGTTSIESLVPFLSSSNENHRINAIELLTIASRSGPQCGFSNPLPEHEYSRMIPGFTNDVIPRLQVLSSNDPSRKVRKEAVEAIKEIRQWIRKHKIPTSASTTTNQPAPSAD